MEKINVMKKNWHILFLATVFFFSCRKKDFPDTVPSSKSDFYFSGAIDGSAISLKAGYGKYYMYSSYTQDTSLIYRFVGELKQVGCSNCGNTLKVTINDYKYSSINQGAKIDSSLSLKPYSYLGVPFYAVQFKSLFNKTAASYLWNFGDKSSSAQANPLHIYRTIGNYSVSLKINAVNGCQQYISNIEKIRYPITNCKISATSNSANMMSFSALIFGTSSYTYHWNFGDGFSSSVPNPSHTYLISGTYPVVLRLIDANQDTLFARYNVATQTTPMPCISNYSIESVTQVVNPLPFSNVSVSWTDENGDIYTSNNPLQPTTSSFKILSVEDYDLNERGEKTKKIKISFTCKVYNGARMKTIDNAEAVICVSYK